MNGRAPNSPATGSQPVRFQKVSPNLWMDSCEWRQSSNATPATIRMTSIAKKPVPSRKNRSSALRREDGVFDMSLRSGGELELDPLDGLHLEGDDTLRDRSISEVLG